MCFALLSGGRLYFIDKKIFSPQEIFNALKMNRISHIILSSSILATLPQENLPDLKVIAVGGEPVNQGIIDFWKKAYFFQCLWNN